MKTLKSTITGKDITALERLALTINEAKLKQKASRRALRDLPDPLTQPIEGTLSDKGGQAYGTWYLKKGGYKWDTLGEEWHPAADPSHVPEAPPQVESTRELMAPDTRLECRYAEGILKRVPYQLPELPDGRKMDPSGPWLMEPTTGIQVGSVEVYDPLTKRGLLKHFLDIPYQNAKRDQALVKIREFAAMRGMLGSSQAIIGGNFEPPVVAEHFEYWREQAFYLALLVRVQRLLCDKRPEAVKPLKSMLGGSDGWYYFSAAEAEKEQIQYHWGTLCRPAAVAGIHADHQALQDYEVQIVAFRLMTMHVNLHLERFAKMSLEMKRGARIAIVPLNLLGALYVHFAMEAIGQKPTHIPCATSGCPSSAAHNSQYCSPTCGATTRQRKRRERLRQAPASR